MFSRVGDYLFKLPLPRLALILFGIMLVRTGVWVMGSFPEQIQVTFQPYINSFPYPEQQVMFWNYLNPFLANIFLTSVPTNPPAVFAAGFFIYCLTLTLLSTWLFCFLVIKRLDDHAARAALLLYFLMPISGTAYFWVGQDGFTIILLFLPFLFPANIAWGAMAGLLLGLQHYEQGLVAYGALLLSLFLIPKTAVKPVMTWRVAAAVLVGITLGKLALMLWFNVIGIHVLSDRFSWIAQYGKEIFSYALLRPYLIYSSVFAAAWLAIFKFAELKELRLPFFLPLAGLLLLPFIIEDETRVLALVSFPLVTAWIFFYPRFLKTLDRPFLGLLAILYIVVPWLWIWRGEARWSAFPYDIAYISHQLFGWPDLPRDMFRWVFPSV